MTPPRSYLLFVQDQARALARQARRCGHVRRERYYSLKEDWARRLLDKLFPAAQSSDEST